MFLCILHKVCPLYINLLWGDGYPENGTESKVMQGDADDLTGQQVICAFDSHGEANDEQ